MRHYPFLVSAMFLLSVLSAAPARGETDQPPCAQSRLVYELAERIAQAVFDDIGETILCNVRNVELKELGFTGPTDARAVTLDFEWNPEDIAVARYWLVPWQSLNRLNEPPAAMDLKGVPVVTEHALVFGPLPGDLSETRLEERFKHVIGIVNKLLDHEKNSTPTQEKPQKPAWPDVQFLGLKMYEHQAVVSIAVPGSQIPTDDQLREAFPGKMIHLFLVPDLGPPQERWIASVGFSCCVPHDCPHLEEGLCCGAYGSLEEVVARTYEPKLTPDTVMDYRPSVVELFGSLPKAELASLPALLSALQQQKKKAEANPGTWVPGNPMLGGGEQDYEPSDEEFIENELGQRIERVVAASTPEDVKKVLNDAGITLGAVDYGRISIDHADVMGSGRFFYAFPPQETQVTMIP